MSELEQRLLADFGKKLDDVSAGVARLDTWARSIDKRLETLNGSVARHEDRIGRVETAATVRDAVAKATEKQSAKYMRWLEPAIKLIVGGLAMLLLEHGPQLVGLLKH